MKLDQQINYLQKSSSLLNYNLRFLIIDYCQPHYVNASTGGAFGVKL